MLSFHQLKVVCEANKKSERMLMRRATASVYFYTVVVLVRNFVKNSFYKCASQPAIAKNSLIDVNATGKVVSSAC